MEEINKVIVKQQPKLTGQIGNTLIYVDPDLEDQKVDILENGVYTVKASEGFDGLNSVEVKADVNPELEEKEITPTKQVQIVTSDEAYGLSKVTVQTIPDEYVIPTGRLDITKNGIENIKDYESVNVDVSPNLQNKSIDVIKNGTTFISADENFDGLGTVEITANVVSETFVPFTYTGYSKNYCSNIGRYIKDVPYLDLGDSTSTYYLLAGASNLEHVGTIRSNKDIIYAAYMFYGCTSLEKIDNIDLRLPTEAAGYSLTYACCYMFCNCNKLEGEMKLDMPTTSGNMDAMFYNCYKIKKIDLSSITTTPTAFVNVFANCYELEELDISGMSIPYTPNTHSDSFKNVGKNLSTPTKVYVKDEATQTWILSLSGTSRPSNWSTENVIIKG